MPTLALVGRSSDKSTNGTSHYYASETQRQARSINNVREEARIAKESLQNAGFKDEEADCLVRIAQDDLKKKGFRANSRTNPLN